MTYIPDCRTDDIYNEDKLNEKNRDFLNGYDFAVKEIGYMFDNLEVYPEVEDILADNKAIICEGKAEKVQKAVQDWAEMSRNDLIVSMIESTDE